jgi:hypothetical protein
MLGTRLRAGLSVAVPPVAIVTSLPVTLAVHFYEAEHHPRPALFGFPPLSNPLGPEWLVTPNSSRSPFRTQVRGFPSLALDEALTECAAHTIGALPVLVLGGFEHQFVHHQQLLLGDWRFGLQAQVHHVASRL